MASFLDKNFSSDDDDDDYVPSGLDKKETDCEEVEEQSINLIEDLKQQKNKKDAKKIFEEMKAESNKQLQTTVFNKKKSNCDKTNKLVNENLNCSATQITSEPKDTPKEMKSNNSSSQAPSSSNKKKNKKEMLETITADKMFEKNSTANASKAGLNLNKFMNGIPEIPGMKTFPQINKQKRKSREVSLDSILQGKKSKLTTFAKSQQDWNKFKKDTGLEEELSSFTKGKDSYVEQQRFLERADLRQFEQEKNLRNKIRSKRT